MLPVLVEIENECVLVVVVYRAPDPLGTFITDFITQLKILPIRQHRTLVVGDFNLDQMLPENKEKFNPIITEFKFHQRSQYSTHILGGILDLVFDNKKSESVEWIPSPYSDHFVLLIQIYYTKRRENCDHDRNRNQIKSKNKIKIKVNN